MKKKVDEFKDPFTTVMSGREKKKILKQRAKSLAEGVEEEKGAEGHIEVVEFILSYERYAIESIFIKEVYPLNDFTPLPCTPDFVMGITNIRGRIVSLIDMKKFFNLPDRGLSNLNRVIIVESEDIEIGILADEIVSIRLIDPETLQSSLPTLTDIRAKYLKGVTDDRVVVLDVKKILSDPEIIIHEEVDI